MYVAESDSCLEHLLGYSVASECTQKNAANLSYTASRRLIRVKDA
jgi:hypothetical protein